MRDKRSSRSRPRSYRDRKVETRDLVERFLIVCEGEKTEPNYFKSFQVPKNVVTVRGFGRNTVTLVEKAIELKREEDYDQVWCVFDRDSFPARDFNDAMRLANKNGINVAYSNEAFELWYLLHFDYCHTAIPRSEYCKRLNKLLRYSYEKNSDTIYEDLESLQPTAIRNARRLLEQYVPSCPEKDNPSTTVHLLVEQLNRFIH
jgi:hypothetical protein